MENYNEQRYKISKLIDQLTNLEGSVDVANVIESHIDSDLIGILVNVQSSVNQSKNDLEKLMKYYEDLEDKNGRTYTGVNTVKGEKIYVGDCVWHELSDSILIGIVTLENDEYRIIDNDFDIKIPLIYGTHGNYLCYPI